MLPEVFPFDIILTLRIALYALPFILGIAVWNAYLFYIRRRFIQNIEWVTLEVRMPKEIRKSPQAMEVALAGFHHIADGNLGEKYIKGKLRQWSSLEIASFGGDVHFYLHIQKDLKNLIEANIYAQYPEVELVETEDYTKNVPFGVPGSNWDIWGCEFEFTKDDFYPIKTYIDLGLDRSGTKEEEKVDPLLGNLEFLGALPPGMQIWNQITIVGTRPRFHKKGTWFAREEWRDYYADAIKKFLKRDKKPTKEEPINFAESQLSPGEKQIAEAIERNMSKIAFDCGLRAIYLAPKEIFNKGYQGPIMNTFKHYGSITMNGFKPTGKTHIDYAWQDLWGKKLAEKKADIFGAFRRRGYFFPPFDYRKPLIMSAEEIATMYHFPGSVAATPTLQRIESKRGEPPPNLPI